jgi:Uma2 family endonuclease
MSIRTGTLRLSDYARLYEEDGPFEIIDGERRRLMPPVARHGLILRALFLLVHTYCQARKAGQVFTELPFVLTYDSDWVRGSRVPDLMVFTADRWRRYTDSDPHWPDKPFVLVPDLAVEIVSANDRYTDVQNKVAHYLTDGVRLVWVIDPEHQQATVYTSERYAVVSGTGALEGGDVLPGLSIRLDQIFTV